MATYTVRSVLEWKNRKGREKKHVYEERLTIWNSDSLDEAIELAEKEETEYINDSTSENESHSNCPITSTFHTRSECRLEGSRL
jgi:hypothetical protein